jgi:two-component system, cell cycle sensor histidine kinase and response regulator CckA
MYFVAMDGTKTILLAEDEEAVRKLVKLMLIGQGYHVLEADSGEAALETSESHQGPIHLLLTDIVMPKITGKELADILCSFRKEMRVVFMSGYPRDTHFEKGVCHEKVFFLQKPFSLPILVQTVREVLDMTPQELRIADHG